MQTLFAFSLGVALVCSAHPEESQRITEWIDQLGSAEFDQREEASRALDALGASALDALRKASEDEDIETSRRAAQLVRRIERRIETTRLLTPKRVHLLFKNKPLTEAAAEFSKQTGYRIQVEGDKAKLDARKITLDTGDVPFWDAYEAFCRAAGLVEKPPVPTQNGDSVVVWQAGAAARMAGRMRFARTVRYQSDADVAATAILIEGQPDDLPTHQAGAVRIRALPPKTPFAGVSKAEGETLLVLDVQCDPQLIWHGLVGMRVYKAIDDQGQHLSQPTPYLEQDATGINGVQEFIIVDSSNNLAEAGGGGARIPLRLEIGRKSARVLREVQGTVSLRVEGQPEPLLAVENILMAAGQTAKCSDGGFLKVIESKQEADGRVKIKLQMLAPDVQLVFGGRGRAFVRGRGRALLIADGTIPAYTDRLHLLDKKGLPIPSAGIEAATPLGNGPQEITLYFRPAKDQSRPAKLVYMGRPHAILEVPFTLKNLKLP
jgi:hypothetical protein